MLKRKIGLFLSVFTLVMSFNSYHIHATATDGNVNQTNQEQTGEQVLQNKWPQAPEIQAQSGLLYNIDSDQIIFESKCSKKLSPAGLTKYMTALLLAENRALTDTITMEEGQLNGENVLGIPLQAGENLSVADCLAALMTSSSNEVANQVAVTLAGGSEEFALMMNERAKSLGCSNTNFVNPTGLFAENQKTSLMDLKNICKAVYANEQLRNILVSPIYTIPATNMTGEPRELRNSLSFISGSENAYNGLVGGKQTSVEGEDSLVVGLCQRAEASYMVFLGGVGADNVEAESKKLLDYGYQNFMVQDISQGMEVISGGKGILPINVSIGETTRAEKATDEHVKLFYYYENFGVGEVTVTIPSWNAFIDPSSVAEKEVVPVDASIEEKEEDSTKKAEADRKKAAYEEGLHKVYVGTVIAVGVLFMCLIITLFAKIITRKK